MSKVWVTIIYGKLFFSFSSLVTRPLSQPPVEKYKYSKIQDEPKASSNTGSAESSGKTEKHKIRRTATKSLTANRTSKRREKLYCICQTPYDDRK
jgi:hypothetical protein